jgi:hypothetical protein
MNSMMKILKKKKTFFFKFRIESQIIEKHILIISVLYVITTEVSLSVSKYNDV